MTTENVAKRKFKMSTKDNITNGIDINDVDINELGMKDLYKLADRAERLVRRIKSKKMEPVDEK